MLRPKSMFELGAAHDLVANAVTLYHPCPDSGVLVFPGAFNAYWGRFLSLASRSGYLGGIPVEDMTPQPLEFLSGSLKGSLIRCNIKEKEGFAIVSLVRHSDYVV